MNDRNGERVTEFTGSFLRLDYCEYEFLAFLISCLVYFNRIPKCAITLFRFSLLRESKPHTNNAQVSS